MTKINLTHDVFRTLKPGDVISNKRDYTGGPAGYDYWVVEGYTTHNGEGRVKIHIVFGKDNKYKGQPYYMYESEIDKCLGLYLKR